METNYLDATGFYFNKTLNIKPGQNMDLETLTKEQAQDILKSNIINSIDSGDLKIIERIGSQEHEDIPAPTRVGQVWGSSLVENKAVGRWLDLQDLLSSMEWSSVFFNPSKSTLKLGKSAYKTISVGVSVLKLQNNY